MIPLHGKLPLAPPLAMAACFFCAAASAQGTVEISRDPFDNPGSQHQTEVEPHVFANGSTIVATFQQGRYFGGGSSDIGFATSVDGGATWRDGSLPGLTRFVGGDRYESVSDPSVAYSTAYGLWLIESLPVGGLPAIFVSRSPDGLSWDLPITAATGSAASFFDKPWITCDNTPSSPFFGNCYIEWDDAFQGDLILMSTSTDGGATWSEAITTEEPAQGLGGQPLVRADGRVVVPYRSIDGGMRSFSSDNGGTSWSRSVQVSTLSEHFVAGDLRAIALPSAAIDGDGTVYLAWADCRFRPSCRANDIIISTSPDGLAWSTPARVALEDPSGPGEYFIPGLGADRNTFAPNVGLALVYYYYPQASCTPTTCRLIGGFATSSDGGRSWSAPIDVTPPMMLDWLAETNQGRMVGDYLGAYYTDDGVPHPAFASAVEPVGQFLESMFSTCADCPARVVVGEAIARCGGGDCPASTDAAAVADTARPEAASEGAGLRIVAPSSNVNIGAILPLRAIGSSRAGSPIAWSIEEGSSGGSVSDSGVFQAPVVPGVYRIVASDGVERAQIEIRVFTVR